MSSRGSARASAWRCVVVFALITLGVGAALRLLASDVAQIAALHGEGLRTAHFDEVLVPGAAVALSLCLVWFWVIALATCLEAGTALRVGFGPRVLRRAVLAACGLAMVAGIAPAHADPGTDPDQESVDRRTLAGLPFPDRPTSDQPAPPGHDKPVPPHPASQAAPRADGAPQPTTTHTVAPGDTLWHLAEQRLDRGADDAEIIRAWQTIWSANRDAIGHDPDLIHPGTTLDLTTLNDLTTTAQEER